jgi:hypothetical protein
MPVAPHNQKTIDDFFLAIEPLKAAHGESTFSYVAIKSENRFVLVQAFLHLVGITKPTISQFNSQNVRAGRYRLTDLAESPRTFIDMVLSGKIVTPDGEIFFPGGQDGNHSAWVQPFHTVGLQNQNRTAVLGIIGSDQFRHIQQPQLDWELKACLRPYDGLQELMTEYGLGVLHNDKASLEVIASNVAAIDFGSPINGTKATIVVRLAKGLSPEKLSVGIRVLHQEKIMKRFRKDGSEFQWKAGPEYQTGSLTIDIPEGAVLHCIANYDELAQHYGWLVDPSTTLNARRATYDTFDSNLAHLKELFGRTSFKGHDARELESAVSWLLWMLGLSVTHLGSVPKMQDAVDLLVTAPSGHIAVVEVTTGILKAENKLALLHDRAQSVRRNLQASGNRHIRVLAVIVTSQPRADVEVDIEQAEKLGILVVTHEILEQGVARTALPQNPDKFFEDAEQQIKLALAKHESQQGLPFADNVDI